MLQETNDFDVLTSMGMQSVSDLSERLDDVWNDDREIILRENDNKELEEEPSTQETSNTEIINLLSHAGCADLIYNKQVLNSIEAVLIQLGYDVNDD